ncbi:MAG: hypothetical protein ABI690_18845 [Chloroflexota bacterium]
MIEVTVNRAAVNIEALDEQLRTAFGSATSGFSIGAGQVTVYLADNATPTQVDQARAIVISHDPSALTVAQQAALISRQKLDQARRDYDAAEIDLTPYAGKDPLLVALAQKIVWLEREIVSLRAEPLTANSTSPSHL